MNLSDKKNQDIISDWLTEKTDILPSRISHYAELIVCSGIGSIPRLAKKFKKNPSFLVELGIEEDDAEEIKELVEKLDTNEKKQEKKTKVTQRNLPVDIDINHFLSSQLLKSLSLEYQNNGSLQQINNNNNNNNNKLNTNIGEIILSIKSNKNSFNNSVHISITRKESSSTQKTNVSFEDLKTNSSSSLDLPSIKILRSRSDSLSSLSATSFDQVLDSFDEKQQSSKNTSTQIILPLNQENLQQVSITPRKLPVRINNLNNGSLLLSREHMDIASTALGLVSGFIGFENLKNDDIINLLQSILDGSNTTNDKAFYLNCLCQLEICKQIVFILNHFIDSYEVCKLSCQCISLFCQYEEDRKSINLENIEEFGYYDVCKTLSNLLESLIISTSASISNNPSLLTKKHDLELILTLICAIGKLSHLEQNIVDFTNFRVCHFLLQLLQLIDKNYNRIDFNDNNDNDNDNGKNDNNDNNNDNNNNNNNNKPIINPEYEFYQQLLSEIIICIRNLSQHEITAQLFLSIDIHKIIIEKLLEFCRNRAFSIICIRAIIMLGNVSDGSYKMGESGACNTIILSMTGNDGSPSVVEWALMGIEMLLSCKDNIPRLLQTSICEVMMYCLNKNITIPSIARGSARVVQILAADDNVRTKLGDVDACDIFSRTLRYHLKNSTLAQVCCGAIGSLAASHSDNRNKLMIAGVGKDIIETLRYYSSGGYSTTMNSSTISSSNNNNNNNNNNNSSNNNLSIKSYEGVIWQACWTLRQLISGGQITTELENLNLCEILSTVGITFQHLPDIITQVLRVINVLCNSPTSSTLLNRVGQSGLCKTIIKCISKHLNNTTICLLGIESVYYISQLSNNIEKFMNTRVIEIIVEIIEIYSSTEPELAEKSCQTINRLISLNELTCTKVKNLGGAQAILWILQRQLQNEKVVIIGCQTLCSFLTYSSNHTFFGTNGACEIVLSIWKTYIDNSNIIEFTLRAIYYLAIDNDNNRAWLGASGACNIIHSLKEHFENPQVCEAGLSAIASLSNQHEGNNKRFILLNSCEIIIRVMKKHIHYENLINYGNLAIYFLGEFPESVQLLRNSDAIACVIMNLLHHKQHIDIIGLNGFQALSRLSNSYDKETFNLLINANINPAMITLMETLIESNKPDVIRSSLKVIENLSKYIENRESLGKVGICEILATILRKYYTISQDLIFDISRICILLMTTCDNNIISFLFTDIADTFINCMKLTRLEDKICSLICEILVLLCSKSPSTNIFTNLDSILIILKYLTKIKDNDDFVIPGIKLITFLCNDSNTSLIVAKSNGIKLLSTIIMLHINNLLIVQESINALKAILGCNLDEYFLIEPDISIKYMTFETCEAFSNSFKNHGNDINLNQSILSILICLTKIDSSSGFFKQSSNSTTTTPSSIKNLSNNNSDNGDNNNNSITSTTSATTTTTSSSSSSSSNSTEPAKPLWKKITSIFSSSMKKLPLTSQESMSPVPSRRKSLIQTEKNSTFRNILGSSGMCEGILQSLKYHYDHSDLIYLKCQILSFLSQSEENIDLIQKYGGSEVLSNLFNIFITNENILIILSPIIESLIIHSNKKNSTLVISKLTPSCGIILCELNFSFFLVKAIQEYMNNSETIIKFNQIMYQLASCGSINQTIILQKNPELIEIIMNLLSIHLNDSTVIETLLKSLVSLLKNHQENILSSSSIINFSVLLKVLIVWKSYIEIIKNVLWIFKTFSIIEVSNISYITPPPSPSHSSSSPSSLSISSSSSSSLLLLSQFGGGPQLKKLIYIDIWRDTDIQDEIIKQFIDNSKNDSYICMYSCEILSLFLETNPQQYPYLYVNQQSERCLNYTTKGVTSVLAEVLFLYPEEEVIESTLLLCALLTRRIDHISLKSYRSVGVLSLTENLAIIQPTKVFQNILNILQKYQSNINIICSILYVVNNLLVDHTIQQEFVSSLRNFWKIILYSTKNPQALQHSYHIISTIIAVDISLQEKIMTMDILPLIITGLQEYLSYSQIVLGIAEVITTLCQENLNIKQKISTNVLCKLLIGALEAYSLNEVVAVELCRSITFLMEDSPRIIQKFNEVSIGQVIFGLLQSFGCGRELERCATAVEWCCRILICVVTIPNTINSNNRINDSYDEQEKKISENTNWSIFLGNLGICETLLLVLEKISSLEHIVKCVINLLLILSNENENKQRLIQANAQVVFTTLKDNFNDSTDLIQSINIIITRLNENVEL